MSPARSNATDTTPRSGVSSSSIASCVSPDVMERSLPGAILKLAGGSVFFLLLVLSLSGVIYLQWLPVNHLYLVPVCRISEDLPHNNFPFFSMQLVGPDLNLTP